MASIMKRGNKLKDAKQNVALFFREDERTQHHER